jgi:hypothetical protein
VTAPEGDRTNGSDLALAAAVAIALVPTVLLGWTAGRVVLRRGARRWHLAITAVIAALPLVLVSPGGVAATTAADALGVVRGTPGGLAPSWALLWAAAGLLARLALRTAPLGVPTGLAVAAANSLSRGQLNAEVDPAAQRRRLRAELRRRKQARAIASRTAGEFPDASENSPAPLAVSIGGDLPSSWRAGRYVVLPDHAARLPRLVIGRPGAGKSTYLAREAFLAGMAGRQLVVLDGKGERLFADAILDAYTAGCRARDARPPSTRAFASEPTVHLFPDEPLNVWQGGPAAVVNRLVDIRPWSVESDWFRELYIMALRLAMGAPGEPVTSMAQLVARLEPNQLGRAWAGHAVEAGLVKSLGPKLTDVQVRAGNLAAALGGLLDGDRALGDADLTVVSMPTMAQPSDSEAVLRVLMSDAQHWTAVRKSASREALLMVDEFSAIPGGRGAAINLNERGRSAGVPVLLAGQSYASLGPEDERDRLISAAGTLVLFASSTPDELSRLAGSVQTSEAVLTYESGTYTGRASVTSRARARVDPNTIRQLATGEAVIVAGGHAEHCRIIQAPGSRDPDSRPAAIDPPHRGRPALPWRRP